MSVLPGGGDQRAETGQRVYTADGGSLTPQKEVPLVMQLAWERQVTKLEDQGVIVAGSDREHETLRQMDERRHEEQAKNSPLVVYSNPFTGVEMLRPRPPQRKRRLFAFERFRGFTVEA